MTTTLPSTRPWTSGPSSTPRSPFGSVPAGGMDSPWRRTVVAQLYSASTINGL